jgi:anti-anti-sigma regulatory factor
MSPDGEILQAKVIQRRLYLSWAGEVSFSNVASLTHPLNDTSAPFDSLELDMRAVTFTDSAALQTLVALRRRFTEPNAMRVLVKIGTQPDRVIRLARIDLILTLISE